MSSFKTRQIITGVVVNKKLNLKRSYYRSLRQILYTWKNKGIQQCCLINKINQGELKRHILGKLSYYKSVVGENNNCYLRLCDMYNNAIGKKYFKVPLVYKLSNARYLLSSGNIKPAGNSAADVLEEFLKNLCIKNHILTIIINNKTKLIEDLTIDPLRCELKRKQILNEIQSREIEKLNSIRIMCDHHTNIMPTTQNVTDLINGVENIINEVGI